MVKPREAWDGFFVQVVHCFFVKYNDNIANRKKKGKIKERKKLPKRAILYLVTQQCTIYSNML